MPFREQFERHKGRFKRASSDLSQSALGTPSSSSLPIAIAQTAPATTGHPNTGTHPLSLSESKASTSLTPTRPTTQWAVLEELAGALAPMTEAFGPLRSILDELLGSIHIYEMAAKDQHEYETLQTDLESILQELKAHFNGSNSPKMTTSIESLCKSINDELCSVRILQSESKTRRYLQAGSGPDKVLACYRRVHGYLIRISLNTSLSAQHTMEQKLKDLEEQAKDAKSGLVRSYLAGLSPAFSAYYNSAQATELKRGECTPGTRIGVLAHMNDWVFMSGLDAGSVYWLNGMAGTGKTTIAYSLCTELASKHQLAASFFCSRLLPECRDVQRIIPSIAYQLAQYSLPFRAALFRVLEQDPDVHTRMPSAQFKSLISVPLLEAQNSLPPNLAVVVDALDECENKESTRLILNILLGNALDHPIKFFVCSRPEPEIREEMMAKIGDSKDSQLVLHELDTSVVRADIERYIRASLARLEPTSDVIEKLVADAGVLFIYAATAVRYISDKNFGRNPRGRLQTVLNLNSSTPGMKQKNKPIDKLYEIILRAALEDEGIDEIERGDMIHLLHTIVTAQEPLTISALCGLLKLDNGRARSAIRPLWSVLHITGTSELVTTLHASFPDYIFDIERSEVYYCDRKTQHTILARLCLDFIDTTTPRFNICNLESSFVPDVDVVDLDKRVRQAVPLELAYACQYWSTHVSEAHKNHELVVLVQRLMLTQFLLWLEVMNLTGHIKPSMDVMRMADEWVASQTDNQDLAELIHDAWCFTTSFASNPVSRSTPHIYVSMLPFWPSHRPISRIYKPRHQRLPVAEGTAVDRRQLALLASWSFDNMVRYATFSNNGERVALIVGDDILIVDAHSGRTILDGFKGHTRPITSLDFSPDDTRIVSGSWDKTLRIWNAETGTNILGPLKGHSGRVKSVQYSPNGARIASGSGDKTIRIWDALAGTIFLKIVLPKEFIDRVESIRYSPDGTRIVSGLYNGIICVWNAQNGELVLGPPRGCKSAVRSFDYSPNGKHIVTGLADKSIRVWSAVDGTMVLGPLAGHTRAITSTRYSPNGKHIASGSQDGSLCIWDAQSGQIALGPIQWHTGLVKLSYSPDGTRLISCSDQDTLCTWDAGGTDNALTQVEGCSRYIAAVACSPSGAFIVTASYIFLHIWDAHTGRLRLGPLQGHSGIVTSLSYSPGGSCFASGSNDKTIVVWDAESGTRVLRRLEGHTAQVMSIDYAPDGTSIASGSSDKTIRVWDSQSGNMLLEPLRGHTSPITSVRYSPTGTYIASASLGQIIRVWDTKTGALTLKLNHNGIGLKSPFDFSPNGKCIVAGACNGMSIWDAQSGEVISELLLDNPGHHTLVRRSPDGHTICSTQDRTIHVWESKTMKRALVPLEGHTDWISSIGFLPGSTSMVSASWDGAIRIWDTNDQHEANSSTSSIHARWVLEEDGWVIDSRSSSKLLIWAPHELHASLMRPRNTLLISRKGYVKLKFDNACIGPRWVQCYVPIA